MFAWTFRKEAAVRIILVVMVLMNAVLPTTAMARSPRVENDATAGTSTSSSPVPPAQARVYYTPNEEQSSSLRFSPNPEEEMPLVPEKDELEFSIFAAEGELATDRLITLNVKIRNHSNFPVFDLGYFDKLQDLGEFVSSGESRVEFNAATRTVIFTAERLDPGEEIIFSYDVRVVNNISNTLRIHNADIEYTYVGSARSQTASMGFAENSPLVASDAQLLVPDQAGDGWNSSGRYALFLDEEALSEDAVIVITPTRLPGEGPELQFDLEFIKTDPAAVTAEGVLTEQATGLIEVVETQFESPAYLEINLDGVIDLTNLPADQEPYVATYDEESNVWVKVPIVLENVETNSVTVEAAHFSTWGAGLGNSLPKNGANVLLFDQPYTSLFTGSARYSLPIWTPSGRAGMSPDVSLSYSSATVDGVLGDVQAPWTGVGWNIDGIEIVRKITTNENGYGYINEFALTLNGAAYKLVQDNLHPSRYYTDHDAFLYIERHNYANGNAADRNGNYPPNATGEWWEVVTTDGTRYRMGWNANSEQLALMYGYKCTTNGSNCQTPDGAYASLGYAGRANNLVAMRWRVDRIQDTHGNYVSYTYTESRPAGGGTIAAYDRASYLDTISYTGYDNSSYPDKAKPPSFFVHFVYADRPGDVPNTYFIWDNIDSQLLDRIEVCYTACSGSNIIRTYDFGYSVAPVPNADGTLILTSMDVIGRNGLITTQAPRVRFTYENKPNRAGSNAYPYPRLTKIDNGAGGILTFAYETDGRDANSWYNYRVSQVRVESGLGTAALQSYTYGTPVYAGSGGNPNYGELIGYPTTTENQLDFTNGNAVILSTVHTFGTTGLDTGRELRTEWSRSGTVHRRTTNIYVTDNSKAPFTGWNFRYLYSSLNYELGGGNLFLAKKSVYKRDPATGNLLFLAEYLGGSLYRKTYYEYLINPDPAFYILDTASRVVVTDSSNTVISDTRYHYDDRINAAPTQGDLTLVQKLTGNGSQTVDQRTHYDEFGNVVSSKSFSDYGMAGSDPAGSYYETRTIYDSVLETLPVRIINPLSQETVTDYLPALGLPYRVTDPNGWETLTEYDGLGRTLSVWAPGLLQPGVYYTYPEVDPGTGRLDAPYSVEMQILDTAASPAQYRSVWGIYDGLGRTLQTQVYNADSQKLLVTDSYYDAQGLVFKQSLPYEISASGGYYLPPSGSQFTLTTFDLFGRPLTVTQPGNIVTTTSYDGLATTILDPNNNKTVRTTDGFGRLIKVQEYASASSVYATTSYTYDPADRLVKVLDARGNQTFLQYDWLGRKTWMNDPDMGAWEYQYHPSGNLQRQKDARGVEITFNYDALGRLISKTGAGLNVSYQYGTTPGTIGLRIGMTDGSGTTTWDYSNFGRTVTENRQIGGVTNSMTTATDWLGRPIYVSYPDGETLTYTYDALGRPDSLISDQQNLLVDLAYTALGQIDSQMLGNGVLIDNSYNAANRLSSRVAGNAQTQLLDISYIYDNAGNITQITDHTLNETHTYDYDFLNRLVSAEAYSTGTSTDYKYRQQFTYDQVGNTTQMKDWYIPMPQVYQEPQPYAGVNASYDRFQNSSGSFLFASFMQQTADTETPTPAPTPTQELYTITLQPNGVNGVDAYLLNAAPANNYGAAILMGVGESNAYINNTARGLIRFDLSSIPANAVITSATLSLWTSQDLSDNDRALQVFRLKKPFNESETTWNMADNNTAWETPGASGTSDREDTSIGSVLISASEAPGTEKQISLDPSKVQELADGTFANNGFLLQMETELNDRINFKTSDDGSVSQRPKLIIEYALSDNTPTPSETPTTTETPTQAEPSGTPTHTLAPTHTPTKTPIATNTGMPSPTASATPTITNTPTKTITPTHAISKNWSFTSNTEGWTGGGNVTGFAWENGGYIGGTITGGDPMIYSPGNLGINISANKTISIRLKNTTPGAWAKFYFITNANSVWDEGKSKRFNVAANSNFTEYIIDMSDAPEWTGTLHTLRFDPAGSSGSFSIDYIKIGNHYLTPTPVSSPTATLTPTITLTPTVTPLLDESLKGYWNFDGVTGSTVPDEAPGDAVNNSATLVNGPVIQAAGASGSSIFFDGSNDHASIAHSAEISFTDSFTISAWINPSSTVTNRMQYLVKKGGAGQNYGLITVSRQGTPTPTATPGNFSNGSIAFEVGGLSPSQLTGPVLPNHTWTMVTGVYDAAAKQMRLYINGDLVAAQNVTGSISAASSPLTFSSSSASNVYHGQLDEVRLYNRALSGSEVQGIYNLFVPPLPSATPTATFTPTPAFTATPLPISQQQWGTGSDGALTISSGGTFNLNTNASNGRACADAPAYAVTLLGSTSASLSTAPEAGCLNPGDEVLLIQLTDSSASNYNAGSYEFLRVESVNAKTVTFTSPKKYWYGNGWRSDSNIGAGSGQYRVMLMRVPNYSSVTVNGTLTANAFDGTKYGVLAFRVSSTLSGSGTISGSALGFGASSGHGAGQNGAQSKPGGGGGYSTAGYTDSYNGGGAGGGTYGDPTLQRIFFGSGGGNAGTYKYDNEWHEGAPGGAGGGVVLFASQTINFSGSIISKGGDGISYSDYSGGGSGGSIRIEGGTVSLNAVTAPGGGGDVPGGKGRIAIYYQYSLSVTAQNPNAYKALIGQAPTVTPTSTPINLTPTPDWGTGSDGNLSVGGTFNISTQNSNGRSCPDGGDAVSYSVTSLSESYAELSSVPNVNCLKAGDEIMLIHVFGSGPNTGNYEFLRVGGVIGNTVYFTTPKTLRYGTGANNDHGIGIGGAAQQVMLIRVPNYNNVTINGILTASAFDRYTRGIIVLRAAGTLSGNGVISVNELGVATYGAGQNGPDYESGGGGGYATNGETIYMGGAGGGTYGMPSLQKIFFGSAGGDAGKIRAGEEWLDGAPGGTGGGIIVLSGKNINFSGSITANGRNSGTSSNDYSGAGSGGSIRIEGGTIALNTVAANGGGSGVPGGKGRIAVYYHTSFSGNFTPGYLEKVGLNASPTPTLTPSPSPTAGEGGTPTPAPAGWQVRDFTHDSAHPHAVASVSENQSPAASYQYDENGNMTCRVEDGVTYLQAYNIENRISSIIRLASGDCSAPGNYAAKWDFGYDGDGVRLATLTTTYDANNMPSVTEWTSYYFDGAYETRSDSTTIKYYSFAGQTVAMNDGTGLQYFLTDHLGSIAAVTDASGTLIAQQRYLPFGGERQLSGYSTIAQTDYGYTGQRDLDPGMGGLMDYKARFYSLYLMRFIQPDTLVPDPSNPQAWNRYSYVQGNPLRYTDPSGHEICDEEGDCFNQNTKQMERAKIRMDTWNTPAKEKERELMKREEQIRQIVSKALAIGATILDLLSSGTSFAGTVVESYYAIGGAITGGIGGFGLGVVEGLIVYNSHPLLNPAENVLGWGSFTLVAVSDIVARNTTLTFEKTTGPELTVGQDTLVSFIAAYSGSQSEIGEAFSDTGINGAILAYDLGRLTNRIPTFGELSLSFNGIQFRGIRP